jgi:hypothetical protein
VAGLHFQLPPTIGLRAMPRAAWRSKVRAGANVSFERAMVRLRACRSARILLCVQRVCAAARCVRVRRGCCCVFRRVGAAARQVRSCVRQHGWRFALARTLLVHNHWLQTSCHST